MSQQQLEDRLIEFSVCIIEILKTIEQSLVGITLCKQLIRSGTSSALNYGEARDAESKKDFIHKLKIILKELRESHINLKIIKRANLSSSPEALDSLLDECNQLIAIFVSTIKTLRSK